MCCVSSLFGIEERDSRLFVNLDVQKLRAYLWLLGYCSCLAGFPCGCSVARSAHLFCNAIINSSWLPLDRKRHVLHNMLTQHIRDSRGTRQQTFCKLGRGTGHSCKNSHMCCVSSLFGIEERDSRLFVNLDVQKLRAYLWLLGYCSCLAGFPCGCSVARSAHLFCNAIINSSWLPLDRKRHVLHNMLTQRIRDSLQV